MNLKRVIAILSLLLLLSCGYEAIYSEKKIDNNYNFSINTINLIGDSKINQILKTKLKKILNREKKSIELNLKIDSKSIKTVTAKDKKGDPIRFSIKIITKLEVFENEILKGAKSFEKEFEYNNKSNKFDLKQYEKNIKNNLITNLSNEIIKYLNTIK